jgi:hypothetical protein
MRASARKSAEHGVATRGDKTRSGRLKAFTDLA